MAGTQEKSPRNVQNKIGLFTVLHDGRLAMKFINMVKSFYELNAPASASK